VNDVWFDSIVGRRRWRRGGFFLAIVLCGSAGCHDSTAPSTAALAFYIDAPFCGGTTPFTFQFTLDSTVLGTERLHDKATSRSYEVSAGPHRIRAELVPSYLTPLQDTTVTLHAGATFLDVVSLYCS
jgi:hypothetical protein